MNKRITILILLLMTAFFYSCSSEKKVHDYTPDEIILPETSNNKNEAPEKKKNEKDEYEKLKKEHYKKQSKETKQMMKENAKRSEQDTPLRKKNSFFSFGKNKGCDNNVDELMINAGVRDTR